MKRFILFLVRLRLGVRKYERFRFSNQKWQGDYYWFSDDYLMKHETEHGFNFDRRSGVSLNWLLDKECRGSIVKMEEHI